MAISRRGIWVTVSAGVRLAMLDSLSNLAHSDLEAEGWAETIQLGSDLSAIDLIFRYERHLEAGKLDALNLEKLRNLTNTVRGMPNDTRFNDFDEALRSETVGVHRRSAVCLVLITGFGEFWRCSPNLG